MAAARPPSTAPLKAAALALLAASCGYHHFAGPLEPAGEQGPSHVVADDGSVTFVQGRLEIMLRPLSDGELNRQFAPQSGSGPQSTNPYTFGDTRFSRGNPERQRFTVFVLSVKNYAYPKVLIDPARVELKADNGRQYWSLSVDQLDNYYRIYATGYRGNEYGRYKERLDLLRRTMFQNEHVFSGQDSEGLLVFPALHPDVRRVEAVVHGAVLRFDYRDEPVESVDVSYHFHRDVGRRYHDGGLELSRAD